MLGVMGTLGLLVIAITLAGITWTLESIVRALHEIRDELRKER